MLSRGFHLWSGAERAVIDCRDMLRWSAAPSPVLTGSQKTICSAGAIVWPCIKLFYVPHEFTASLKLAGLQAGEFIMCTAVRTKGSLS